DDILVNRYKETRRRHPLIEKFDGSLPAAIAEERKLIQPIRALADYVIDTSKTSVQECKHRVNELFSDDPDSIMKVRCMSFGFKYGIPNEADIVLDARCLPNPFYEPELKYKTGLEKEVVDYVMNFDESKITFSKMMDLINYMLPMYIEEGKSQLVIAMGCTGGRHRSVCFAEQIKDNLKKQNYKVSIKHRDIDK
ncbi:MAG: RNase adaptor protein RapZ, partial [Ruminococcus sp.]|nr:RNase adaptor protein RapZ [Candidatus Copronaster equi]